MAVSQREKRPVQKQKNRRYRRAKISHYRFINLVECFAMDLSIKQAARRTRISERAVRDIYEGLRDRMVRHAMNDPQVFNGFKALIMDEGGMMEAEVVTFMLFYTKTGRNLYLKGHVLSAASFAFLTSPIRSKSRKADECRGEANQTENLHKWLYHKEKSALFKNKKTGVTDAQKYPITVLLIWWNALLWIYPSSRPPDEQGFLKGPFGIFTRGCGIEWSDMP